MLSDLYALGVINCDNMLMLLGVSQKLTEHDRDIVVPLLIQGFTVSVCYNSVIPTRLALVQFYNHATLC